MSKLSELFKSIGTNLHLGELTRPMWEAVIGTVDTHEERIAALEKASPSAGLLPGVVERLNQDWVEWQARQVERAAMPTAVENAAGTTEDPAQTEGSGTGGDGGVPNSLPLTEPAAAGAPPTDEKQGESNGVSGISEGNEAPAERAGGVDETEGHASV